MGEFGRRVWHVHAKDTIFIEEGLYEFGNLQAATFARKRVFGEYSWRYALPGRGGTPWPRLLGMLEEVGYPGCVSVELEDEDFNGSEEEEMRGLVAARDYLKGV
jgi:sugar phosphate isomerase/epimerase